MGVKTGQVRVANNPAPRAGTDNRNPLAVMGAGAIMKEEAAEDLGDGEDEAPVGDGLEHMPGEPLAELHGPFLMARWAEQEVRMRLKSAVRPSKPSTFFQRRSDLTEIAFARTQKVGTAEIAKGRRGACPLRREPFFPISGR